MLEFSVEFLHPMPYLTLFLLHVLRQVEKKTLGFYGRLLQKFTVWRAEGEKWKVILGFIKWALFSSSKTIMAQSLPL